MSDEATGKEAVQYSEDSAEFKDPSAAEIGQPDVPSVVETYLEKVINETRTSTLLAQWLFFLVRILMICSAAVTAIFVNLTGHADRLVAASTSVVVLLLIALDWGSNTLTRYRTYRSMGYRLNTEKYLFLSKAGIYSGLPGKRAQALLAQRIELIRSEAEVVETDKNLILSDQSGSVRGPVLANYDGEIHAHLSFSPGASSVIGRLACQFHSAEVAAREDLAGSEGTRAIVRIQGEEVDPVEFVVKAMVVAGERITVFPRVVTVYVPVSGVSESFEFALVAESPEPADKPAAPDGKGAMLVDVSQAGRTIQILELEMAAYRRSTSSRRLL